MAGPFMPDEMSQLLRSGLMCFPLTDLDEHGEFDRRSFAARLDWHLSYRPKAIFAAGGAGEFFSLTLAEYSAVVAETVAVTGGRVPVVAAAGFGTRLAVDYAREAERLCCDAVLLLPPYLTDAPQDGLVAHVDAVCKATRLGVVVYSRANGVLGAAAIAELASANSNFIGVKDGQGDIEELNRIRALLGERVTLLNGMPTAETYAPAYFGMDIRCYSSAIFSFLPRTALEFYASLEANDRPAIAAFNRDFLVPYCDIRRRRPGYAVGIVKAALDIVGRSAGGVRPPLSGLTTDERQALAALIAAAGPQ